MGGGSEDVTVGYKYFVGMHMALCHGPTDKLVQIRVGGKKAWVGEETGGQIYVDKTKLFGGEKREGGVRGYIDIEMGEPDQGQNSYLANKLGSSLLPAFRGVMCAILRQVYIGMNPYLKDWGWFTQRLWTRSNGVEQWYKSKVAIGYYQFVDTIPPLYEEKTASLTSYDVVVPVGSYNDVFYVTGTGIRHDPTKQANGFATATWNGTVEWSVGSVEFSFLLHVAQDEGVISDAAYIIFTDENGEDILYFCAHSGYFSGRPRINDDVFLSSSILDLLQWYKVVIRQVDESHIEAKLFLGSVIDGPLVGEATIAGSIVGIRGYRYQFQMGPAANEFLQAVSIEYAGISIHQYLNTPGEDRYGTCSDMNPAHIIRECLTDTHWGMGYPETDINDTSFMAAADTLFDEGMGISMLWNQQTSIEDFVGEILRHIDATLYVDRSTGQFVLKLIRADYDEESLLVLDESNISRIEGYTKQTLAELVNEVTVTYNSNESGQNETITLQNLALIQQQGVIIPSSVEYPGFANEAVALKACSRDLKALAWPLVSATIYANREASGLNIGGVFRWNWTEYDEEGVGVSTSYAMRVAEIAFGDGVDNTIRITCVQDVFALPDITYVQAEETEWANPAADPLAASPRLVTEAPYYEVVRQLGELDAEAKLSSLPELGFLMVASGCQAAEINADIYVDAGAGYEDGGTLDFCPCGALDGAIDVLDTSATLTDGIDLDEVSEASLAQIDSEIVVIESITDGVATIKRGCLDTVPAAHADGAIVIVWGGYTSSDGVEYVDSDEISVKLLTVTGGDALDIEDAPEDVVTMDQRANRPYPPANVQIGGEYFPELIVADDLVGIVVTWSHRDRTQQTGGTVLDWTDASVGPESGVTYSTRLVRTDTEEELDSSTGLSDATVTITPSYRGTVRLEVWTVRDSVESMQMFEHTFEYISQAPVYHETTQVYHGTSEVYYEL